MIKPRHLQQIMVLTEIGTINQAAEALCMTQPSLTNSIKKLEHDLGVTLFERTSKGVKPTLYTEHILKQAPQILQQLDTLHKEIKLLSSGQVGEIHIGTGPVIIHGLMKDVIPLFTKQYPEIEVHLYVDHPKTIIEKIENGILDLGILSTEYVDLTDEFISIPLLQDPTVFVVRTGHPLLEIEDLKFEHLIDYPFVLPRVAKQKVQWLKGQTHDGRTAHISLTVNDYDLLIHHVMHSDAITAGPSHLFQSLLESRDIAVLDYQNPTFLWHACAVYKSISIHSMGMKLFLEMIQEWFEQRNT
ncbi:LysR family transcriptional regulator [Acinetobacter sp. C32I]|uniref:LysR family transcriptional regulator n=1 Tax=Acinetobacter sp. C32I TaxID=2950074 RepID=UPI002036AFCD|nr:LysR family transcriptional regulator [Acinetobacter sp. C32I]USA53805.1 LysR family transcriptional regulator [Acinetobacter sp. C32I]